MYDSVYTCAADVTLKSKNQQTPEAPKSFISSPFVAYSHTGDHTSIPPSPKNNNNNTHKTKTHPTLMRERGGGGGGGGHARTQCSYLKV